MKTTLGRLKRIIAEAAEGGQALAQLHEYATAFDLHVVDGAEEIATQMDIDPEEVVEMGMTAAAMWPDHSTFNVAAFVKDGQLHRFMTDEEGDPADSIPVTFEELMERGDPRS